jgi:hypothetical protein
LLVGLVFVLVGWRRRSGPLIIYWITAEIGVLASLMTRERLWKPSNEIGSGTTWEGWFFYAGLFVLFVCLVRTLKQNRFDLLLGVYAILPLILTAANYVTIQLPMQLDSARYVGVYPVLILIVVNLIWVWGTALLFLFRRRSLRWFGLVFIAAGYALPNLAQNNIFWQVPLMFGGMIALVFIAWALDQRSRGTDHRLAE